VLATVKARPGDGGGCGTLRAAADLDGGCARWLEKRKAGTKERPPDRTKELRFRCVSAPVSDPAPPPHQRRPQSRRNTISTVANILKTQALQAENLTRKWGQHWTPIGGQFCAPIDN